MTVFDGDDPACPTEDRYGTSKTVTNIPPTDIRYWRALCEYYKDRNGNLRAALSQCRLASGLAKAQIIDEALSFDGLPVETPASQPPFREVAVKQVLAAIEAWNKQDGRMCDHDYDLMNNARQELQWILDDHTRNTSSSVEPAEKPYCRKCGGPHWIGQCALTKVGSPENVAGCPLEGCAMKEPHGHTHLLSCQIWDLTKQPKCTCGTER